MDFADIALEKVADLVLITDADLSGPDGPRILYANAALLEQTGYELDEIIGKTPRLFQGAGTDKLTLERLRSALEANGEARERLLNYNKDGTEYWIELNISSIKNEEGSVTNYISVQRNVTEWQSVLKEAEFFRERFELAALAARDVTFDWDLQNGRIWNSDSFRDVFGYEPISEFSIDTADVDFIEDGELLSFKENVKKHMREGADRFQGEFEFVKPSGDDGYAVVNGIFVRSEEGEYQRLVGNTRDISDLLKVSERAEASEARFRVISDLLSDVIWDLDFESDTAWASENWSGKLGLGEENIPFRILLLKRYFKAEFWYRILRSFAILRATNSDAWQHETKIQTIDGTSIDLLIRARVTRDGGGEVSRMIGSVQVITFENRRLESQTRARTLEALGQVAGGIAHDFNNQLLVIQGNVEFLQEASLEPEDREAANLIGAAAQNSAKLTRRLLSFAGRPLEEETAVDLSSAVEAVGSLLSSVLPENIDLQLQIQKGLPIVSLDEAEFEQALVNLAVNARDALPKGGTLIIGCESVVLGARAALALGELLPGRYARVSVSDDGVGIEEKHLPKVFEPFYSTKEFGKGSGLGLSSVYGFAKRCGGTVRILSEVGQGTAVNIYIPALAGSEPPLPLQEAKLSESKIFCGKRVLVVEDNADVRNNVLKLCASLGCKTAAASNAADALKILELDKDFDLLLTDIVMPGSLNGKDLARKVVDLAPWMRVLLTSGYPDYVLDEWDLRSFKLLRKPYKREEFRNALERALRDK